MNWKRTIWFALASCLCAPWSLFICLWFLLTLAQWCPESLFLVLLNTHNRFLHEWPGAISLIAAAGVLIAAIVEAIMNGVRPWRCFLLVVYSLTLCIVGAYTAWWRLTGQTYDWL